MIDTYEINFISNVSHDRTRYRYIVSIFLDIVVELKRPIISSALENIISS